MLKNQRFGVRILAPVLTLFVALPVSAKEATCELLLVPDVYNLNIVEGRRPQPVEYAQPLSSPGVSDSWLKLGRRAVAYPDFKFLADLIPNRISQQERRAVIQDAKVFRRRIFSRLIQSGMTERKAVSLAQAAYARYVIQHLFTWKEELKPLADRTYPRHRISRWARGLDQSKVSAAFDYVDRTWSDLTRVSPEFSKGSLLPSPFPVMIAGGRFRESYYWDTYFGALGLIETGRLDLVAGQLENFLHMIQFFGRVPNGFRDYYLTRSQPPVISRMALLVFENSNHPEKLRWLKERVFPILQHDYHRFWMTHRLDEATGLNFYSDDRNELRPERHANDDERELGESFRDVRAQAESGLDHTDALMYRTARVASVSLNAFLYGYENDLARMAELIGDAASARVYRMAANRRKIAMNRLLWDRDYGVYRNLDLDSGRMTQVIHADMFAALYTGVASPEQARSLRDIARAMLEREGGLMSSTVQSGKQWDGNHGWAPIHVMAIQGLARYGLREDAQRLARKWVNALAEVHAQTGTFYEKIDVLRVSPPFEDGTKYPTQTGFLWTNASFVWALKFLGVEFTPL